MVDEDRVRRLLAMLERYRALLAEDDPDRYRRRHLVLARAVRDGGLDDLSAFAARIAALAAT